MIDFAHGRLSKFGLDLGLSVSPSARISAKPGVLPGEITLFIGDGFGQGLSLSMRMREADFIVDALVDAISTAREIEMAKARTYKEEQDANRND